jgi:lactoylglutathione lyase
VPHFGDVSLRRELDGALSIALQRRVGFAPCSGVGFLLQKGVHAKTAKKQRQGRKAKVSLLSFAVFALLLCALRETYHASLITPIMKIEHVALWTNDLERAKSFYCTYFGGRPNDKYVNGAKQFSSYFLTFSGGARLELMQSRACNPPNPARRHAGGYVHLAFSTGSREGVDHLTDRLRHDGFPVLGAADHGDGYYESVVADPDGNLVEITVYGVPLSFAIRHSLFDIVKAVALTHL